MPRYSANKWLEASSSSETVWLVFISHRAEPELQRSFIPHMSQIHITLCRSSLCTAGDTSRRNVTWMQCHCSELAADLHVSAGLLVCLAGLSADLIRDLSVTLEGACKESSSGWLYRSQGNLEERKEILFKLFHQRFKACHHAAACA